MPREDLGDKMRRQEALQLVEQFEDMLKNNTCCFFGHESYEYIIEFYEDHFEFEKALEVTDYAIEQYPYSSVFLTKKSQFLFECKKCEEALQLLDAARRLSPTDIDLLILEAEIKAYQGHYPEALELLEHALTFADRDDRMDIYLTMSDIHESNGNEQTAFKYIKRTLAIKPDHEEALTRADYYVENNQWYDIGIKLFERILSELPHTVGAWFSLGNALTGLERYTEAIDAYEYATAIDENYEPAYRALGDAYFETNNYQKAEEQYQVAQKLNVEPDDELCYCIALCHYNMENCLKAAEHLLDALHINEDNHEAHFLLGECYLDLQMFHEALDSFNKALSIDQQNPEYLAGIGALQWELGNTETAITFYQYAIEQSPDCQEYWLNLAEIYCHTHAYTEALTACQQIHARFGATDHSCCLIAAALFGIDKKTEALQWFAQVVWSKSDKQNLLFEIHPHLKRNHEIKALVKNNT